MMKYIRIFSFILLYFLCTAKSCDDRAQENVQDEERTLHGTMDSLKTEFQADYLPEASLNAFVENAKQKLVNFADYFRIVADTSLDRSFRDQADQLIRDLFYPGTVQLDLSLPGKPAGKKIYLDELLKGDLFIKYSTSELIIDSIRVINPLHRTGESEYRGVLEFTQGFRGFSLNGPVIAGPEPRKIEIIAEKVRKPFGNDTLLIWKIFLGDMY